MEQKRCIFVFEIKISMEMKKIIGMAVLLLCLYGCAKDNDAIYYPVNNVDIETGGPL